jgi:hypothetical protein
MSRETTVRRRIIAKRRIAERRVAKPWPNYYGKPDQEIVDEKNSRCLCTCSCHSSSRIDGRVLFAAEQAGTGGEASTEGAGGNHRKQRVL